MPLTVSVSPHQKSELNTAGAMTRVIYALVPAVAVSFYFFRIKALVVILTAVLSCLAAEVIVLKARRKDVSLQDTASAVVTALLLAMSLPPDTSWYAVILGSLFAIAVCKHLFGGLGSNIFNPALAARAFLAAAYPKMLTSWSSPFTLDAVTKATPLALRKFDHILTPLDNLFWGNVSGCLGETSAACLLMGGLYLLIKKIADWRIPLATIVTAFFFSLFFYIRDPLNGSFLFHLFSGGFILGVFFMATDPVTTPVTKNGRFIFGAGCGLLIMVIRYFSGLPEGVMYSILFMNAFVPLIDRFTRGRSFGRVK
ncbi:MAG: RnfABCDGE type electron transport complex subunit D [Candidatus Omnitrophota bacterium]